MGGGGIGLVVVLLIVVINNVTGGGSGLGDLGNLVDQTAGTPAANSDLSEDCQTGADADVRDDCRIVGYINSIQRYWTGAFADGRREYVPARTRFFTDAVDTGCGSASSAMGPFYCPRDKYVYIDLGFFDELALAVRRAGRAVRPGLRHRPRVRTPRPGPARRPRRPRRTRAPQSGSVRVELQADCFAGVWASNAVETGFMTQLTQADIADAPRRRGGGGRRPHPGGSPGPRDPGELDARLLRAAPALVRDRLRERQPGGVRHLQRRHLIAESLLRACLRELVEGGVEVLLGRELPLRRDLVHDLRQRLRNDVGCL